MRSLGFLIRKGNMDIDTHGERPCEDREKVAIHTLRREASEDTSPDDTMTLDS